jgi:phosphoribosylformylglycinamidine synthase
MSETSITARVHITLKAGVVDPQGSAIGQALKSLGFDAIAGVRVGRTVEVDLAGRTQDEMTKDVSAMCERLLANPVIENYRIEILSSS